MTTAVVGAGPVGLLCAHVLAERGEDVLLVDPDRGPAADGTWRRTGVMQFGHPHFFRHLVRQVLEEQAPQLWDAVATSDCVVNAPPDGIPPQTTTVSARRSTFEAALRSALSASVVHVAARADEVVEAGDRVTGLVAGGRTHDVDRVVVATGRSGRLGERWRPEEEPTSSCRLSYVSRTYRARPGVEPLTSWVPLSTQYDGYLAVAFPQDAGTLSALVLRRARDASWAPLWRAAGFEAVAAAVPQLAPWTDPERFTPVTDVARGGTLVNAYRRQGSPPAGLLFVGDAVSATNPAAGRGVSLGLLQAGALLDLLGEHDDPKDVSAAFDAWCDGHVRPWYEDHVANDAANGWAFDGEPFDPDGPITSDVVALAADADPSLAPMVLLHQGMVALPESLRAAEPRVRALLRRGWRPRPAPGPTRDDLVGLLADLPAS